jgi:hypothetical protein
LIFDFVMVNPDSGPLFHGRPAGAKGSAVAFLVRGDHDAPTE